MKNLTEFEIGTTLSFVYDGGSTPGRQRVVVVEEYINEQTIAATDLELPANDNRRNFRSDLARNIQVLETVPFYTAQEAVQKNMTAEDIGELYRKAVNAEGVFFNVRTGDFLVQKADQTKVEDIDSDDTGMEFTLRNSSGEALIVRITVHGNLCLLQNEKYFQYSDDVKTFFEKIVEHLDKT